MTLFCNKCKSAHVNSAGHYYCARFRKEVSTHNFCEESGDDEVSEEKEKAYKRVRIDGITVKHLKQVAPFEDDRNDVFNIGVDANNEPEDPIEITIKSGFEGGGHFILDMGESEIKALADAINTVLVIRYRKERFRDNGQC